MSRLRVGVVGVGRLGAEHARILSTLERCQLVGVCDTNRDRAAEVGARHGVPTLDFDELIGAVEALVVAVPTQAHATVAESALRSGCHVLVEKPLTPTLAEADELIGVARDRKVLLAVGHVERFNPAVRASRTYLDDPRFIASQRLASFQPRGTDVPVMLDLMIHDIDLVLGLVDSPVCSVHAVGVPVLTGSVDMANARIVFENGAVADISASRVSVERTRALRIFQETGYLSLDLADGTGEFLRRRPGVDPVALWKATGGTGLSLGDVVERVHIRGDQCEPLRLELEAFRDAVLGRESDCVSATDGRAALEVALRIEQEIKRSSHVSVQDS